MINLQIVNDRTGTEEIGNYNIKLTLPNPKGLGWIQPTVRVEGYERRRGWAELVREAISKLEADEQESAFLDWYLDGIESRPITA